VEAKQNSAASEESGTTNLHRVLPRKSPSRAVTAMTWERLCDTHNHRSCCHTYQLTKGSWKPGKKC